MIKTDNIPTSIATTRRGAIQVNETAEAGRPCNYNRIPVPMTTALMQPSPNYTPKSLQTTSASTPKPLRLDIKGVRNMNGKRYNSTKSNRDARHTFHRTKRALKQRLIRSRIQNVEDEKGKAG